MANLSVTNLTTGIYYIKEIKLSYGESHTFTKQEVLDDQELRILISEGVGAGSLVAACYGTNLTADQILNFDDVSEELVEDVMPRFANDGAATAEAWAAIKGRALMTSDWYWDTALTIPKYCTSLVGPTWAAFGPSNSVTSRLTTTDGVGGGTAKVVGGLSYSNIALGTTLTNSAAETLLGNFTIPANTLKAGSTLFVKFGVLVADVNAGDGLEVKLRLGPTTLTGQELIATGIIAVSVADIAVGEFRLISFAAPGAAVACVGSGFYCDLGAPGTAAMLAVNLDSTVFVTNGALRCEVTGQWDNAHGDNKCHLTDLSIIVI